MENDFIGYECKFASYAPCKDNDGNDLVLVKRVTHCKDGTKIPEIKFIENYKRPFWVVNDAHRTYKEEKKAWEDISKCRKFTTTQANLNKSIQTALGKHYNPKHRLSITLRSPYVYGADISTPALIKKAFMDKYPECVSDDNIAVMDIETDVVTGNGKNLISASFTFNDEVYIGYTKEFMDTYGDPREKIQELYRQYINGDMVQEKIAQESDPTRREFLTKIAKLLEHKKNIEIHSKLFDTSAGVVKFVFDAAHKSMPDFVAFWNMNYDIPIMEKALHEVGISPESVFNDPSVPYKYRRYKHVPGEAIKRTATGKSMSKHPAELWPVVHNMASFYLIDAMCVFKQVRVTEGNRNSYSLDNILKEELDLGKLKFSKADHETGLGWHVLMQSKYKLEYLIYNIFDCMSIEILDSKTKDLAMTIPTLCQHSEYNKFPSTPRRLCDDLHFFLMEHGKVIATTSDNMVEELDKHVTSMNGWVVTLPSHLVQDNGLAVLKEAPHIKSLIRTYVCDIDVEAGYPKIGYFFNVAQETTEREMVSIAGLPESLRRLTGINLTAPLTNAAECSRDIFKLPTPMALLDQYRKEHAA